MASQVRVAINGAFGRMGQRLIALASADAELQLVAALECAGHPKLGEDAGLVAGVGVLNVPITADLRAEADVMVDFTAPASTLEWLTVCQRAELAMVIGTTGLDAAAERTIELASETLPIVRAANMSVGVNVLLRVVGEVARALGPDFDIEIVEAHHRFKKDAPSGTALALAKAIVEATGRDMNDVGPGPRTARLAGQENRQIVMHALRLGDTVGEHEIHFGTLGETVKIAHSAHTRDTFAFGGLRAAKWLAGRESGLYSMQDVLFNSDPRP